MYNLSGLRCLIALTMPNLRDEQHRKIGWVVILPDGAYGEVVSWDRTLRLAKVKTLSGVTEHPEEDCVTYAYPAEEYAALSLPPVATAKRGTVVNVEVRRSPRVGVVQRDTLAPYQGWVYRAPRGLYLHPNVRVRFGETVCVVWTDGSLTSMLVPKNYGTVASKRALRETAEATARNASWWDDKKGEF